MHDCLLLQYFIRVTAADTYDGMVTAAQVFVDYTLSRCARGVHATRGHVPMCWWAALVLLHARVRPHAHTH
jgi:hypothetical protein